jgi:hypothetical protein
MNEDKICTCICHKEGYNVMHCMPCCKYTYEKYIKSNGEIDMDKYKNIVKTYKNKERK